jgi:hypothetical protein
MTPTLGSSPINGPSLSPIEHGKLLSQSYVMSASQQNVIPSSTQPRSVTKALVEADLHARSKHPAAKAKKDDSRKKPVSSQAMKVVEGIGAGGEEFVLTKTAMLGLLEDPSFMSEVGPFTLFLRLRIWFPFHHHLIVC